MTSSAQEIYTILVRRIIRDHYPREKALPSERDIADEFETSRTVIRGVLKRLESEKYVEMVSPRKRRISSAQPASVFDPGSKLVGIIGANNSLAGPDGELFISQRRIRGLFRQLDDSGLSSLNLSASWPPAMMLELLSASKIRGLIYVDEYHVLPPETEMFIYRTLNGRLPISTFGDTERLEHGAVGGIERSSSDHRAGAKLLVQFLAERGCRKVLWYFPARNHPRLLWQAERQAGCEEAAREAKIELLPLDTPLPITNEVGSAENFRRCARMTAEALAPHVKSTAPVEAILVDSDVAVPYFQRALRELGTTPGEIPVLGYDNYYATTRPYRWEPTPPAATVDKNDPEIGREAVGLLRKRLESDDIFSRPFRSVIRPRLVIPQ